MSKNRELMLRCCGLLAASLLLAGCSSYPGLRNESGYDNIQNSLDQATRQKAPTQDAINEALLPPLSLDIPVAGKPVEPRFDLAVSGAPASQVFLAIVSGTRYSMLLPPDLGGSLTLNLKNVTVREALESIREIYGYEFSVQGNRIAIQPNTMQTRLYQLSYLSAKRGGGSATRVTSSNMNATSGGAYSAPGGAAGGSGSSAGLSESTTVYTGQSSDFWFDLGQAMAVTLNCDFDIQRGTGTVSGSTASVAMSQAMSQRIDKMKCPEGRNFVVNPQSGVVMVRAMPAELREISRMLKAMQASVERQVMIEAKILEVELSEGFQSGINWASFKNGGHQFSNNAQTNNFAFPGGRPFTSSSTNTTVSAVDGTTVTTTNANAAAALTGATGILNTFPVAGAIGLAFQATNFAAIINFLQTQGNVYVMSSPRIATLNNQKAVLKVGSDDYYVTSVTPPSYSTSTTSGSATSVNPPTITTQPFFSGVSLDVTPQIDENGSITLHVRPAVSEVSEKEKVISFGTLGTYSLPYASTKVKETDSIVKVRDGMIVAIGGMMTHSQSDQNARVPGLGDVPIFSALFKQNAVSRGKREMVVLLKPTVIREDADWQGDLEETQDRVRGYDPRINRGVIDPLKPQ
ncbi:MAG: pilus (MSHA type) biogenesis protein MshL [Bacteroidota bacterium]